MRKFCRHGTLVEACPICRASVESSRRTETQQSSRGTAARRTSGVRRARAPLAARSARLTIRHEAREIDDGYRSALAPGLRSSVDAERLARELARASGRIAILAGSPPGLYGELAREPDLEEASWLALLIAYIGPLEPPEDPFTAIAAARTSWHGGELPRLEEVAFGPRSPHDRARAAATLLAYRRWAERFGSQRAAIVAEPSWSATQRFERAFERLSLPGLDRRARYDLLLTLGASGRYELVAPSLLLNEDDPVSRAAKRVFGIGERMLLEQRARALAQASELPIAAFDLGLENWAAATPLSLGVPDAADPEGQQRARSALGL